MNFKINEDYKKTSYYKEVHSRLLDYCINFEDWDSIGESWELRDNTIDYISGNLDGTFSSIWTSETRDTILAWMKEYPEELEEFAEWLECLGYDNKIYGELFKDWHKWDVFIALFYCDKLDYDAIYKACKEFIIDNDSMSYDEKLKALENAA